MPSASGSTQLSPLDSPLGRSSAQRWPLGARGIYVRETRPAYMSKWQLYMYMKPYWGPRRPDLAGTFTPPGRRGWWAVPGAPREPFYPDLMYAQRVPPYLSNSQLFMYLLGASPARSSWYIHTPVRPCWEPRRPDLAGTFTPPAA